MKGLRCSEESRFLGNGVSNLMPDLLGTKRVSGEVQILPVSMKTRKGRTHLPHSYSPLKTKQIKTTKKFSKKWGLVGIYAISGAWSVIYMY